ncbi:alpha/beta hydrolase [Emticicia sp. BO119]|nr:alpha/beta hydrolase [Emticicia sp. BO119]
MSKTDEISFEENVSIGDFKLFVSVKGSSNAKYSVIFESGGGGTSKDWEKVRNLLPSSIRTVTYDRAGSGKSGKGPLPRTMRQEVFELHELLKKIYLKGPYILVGQSLGGLLTRLYTEQYGNDVIGLVLVDPTHESSMLGSMRYNGWVRLREKAEGKTIPKPQIEKPVAMGYDSTADYLAEEFQALYLSRIKKPQALGNRPLIILGAGLAKQPPGTPDEQWQAIRKEKEEQKRGLTSLSSNSKFILDPQSGHNIQYDNPAIVANAIESIIKAIDLKQKIE